ncbi:conserved exported hypothetical protein [Bradyrhizobium sp. ORS 375]|uniref:hypothetical protein n=1 Tax=Bradyrhizobium sp. (strain ORS 375) TaxID=566679 RepID=UPI000240A1AD|nr:hypothetical protein [Bradyrhizobium sp. ORS 375]CCD93425.1 conserved exported hypothetical protein [Bradyrhizobium sp. ORS 375]
MKKLGVVILVAGQSALTQAAGAQSTLAPKPGAAKRADVCAPIGRTEDGKLVYSMKCESIPRPISPAAAPQAAAQPAPAASAAQPEAETERSGLFGWSYDRRPKP